MVALNGEVLSNANSPMELGYLTLNWDTDVLTIDFPSGGGMFDPAARAQDQVTKDLQNGLISSEKGATE